ncbi:hypothetical protein [Claveliimonas bilis]|nr:hypothetical protein [Claveliimonas bilis]
MEGIIGVPEEVSGSLLAFSAEILYIMDNGAQCFGTPEPGSVFR